MQKRHEKSKGGKNKRRMRRSSDDEILRNLVKVTVMMNEGMAIFSSPSPVSFSEFSLSFHSAQLSALLVLQKKKLSELRRTLQSKEKGKLMMSRVLLLLTPDLVCGLSNILL